MSLAQDPYHYRHLAQRVWLPEALQKIVKHSPTFPQIK